MPVYSTAPLVITLLKNDLVFYRRDRFFAVIKKSTILEIDLMISCGLPFKMKEIMEHYAVVNTV